MTFEEAITKTKETAEINATLKKLKKRFMRKIYRRVCKKIRCEYCPVSKSCHFCYAIHRGLSFRDALLYIDDKDVLTVLEWSEAEVSK